jgi:hypothetical protein
MTTVTHDEHYNAIERVLFVAFELKDAVTSLFCRRQPDLAWLY